MGGAAPTLKESEGLDDLPIRANQKSSKAVKRRYSDTRFADHRAGTPERGETNYMAVTVSPTHPLVNMSRPQCNIGEPKSSSVHPRVRDDLGS